MENECKTLSNFGMELMGEDVSIRMSSANIVHLCSCPPWKMLLISGFSLIFIGKSSKMRIVNWGQKTVVYASKKY